MVEVQLTMPPVPEKRQSLRPKPPQATTSSVEEYDSRRCEICGPPYPVFGIGPPATQPGVVIWAYPLHRGDVEASLTAQKVQPVAEAFQGSVL